MKIPISFPCADQQNTKHLVSCNNSGKSQSLLWNIDIYLFLITLFTLCTKVEKQNINLELNFIPTKISLLLCKWHWWKIWTKLLLHCPFNCPQRQRFKNDGWAQGQHSHVLPHPSSWMSHGVQLLVTEFFFSNPLDPRKTRNWKHMDKDRECCPQGFHIINYEYLGA